MSRKILQGEMDVLFSYVDVFFGVMKNTPRRNGRKTAVSFFTFRQGEFPRSIGKSPKSIQLYRID